jgi:hypothetical protein
LLFGISVTLNHINPLRVQEGPVMVNLGGILEWWVLSASRRHSVHAGSVKYEVIVPVLLGMVMIGRGWGMWGNTLACPQRFGYK